MGSKGAQPAHDAGATGLAPAHFFTGACYGRALDALLQVADQAGTVATVIGARQSGKTALCRTLASIIDPSVALLRINGNLVRTVLALDTQLRQCAGAAPPRVLVDDAQRLPRRCLLHLLQLAAEGRLVLFLFGTWRLRLRLRGHLARSLPGRLRIDLPTLTDAERRAYLDWFLINQVPEGAMQLASAELAAVLGDRHRLPGAIEAAALRRLGCAAPPVRNPSHLVLLAFATIMLASIGALILLATTSGPRALPSEVPGSTLADTTTHAPGSVASGPPTNDIDSTPLPAPGLEPGAATAGFAVTDAIGEPDAEAAVEGGGEVETAARAEMVPSGVDPTAPEPLAAAPGETAEPPEPGPVAPLPSTGLPPANARDWVLAQPAGHYTLQIAVVSSAERAAAFIRQQPDSDDYVTYPIRVAAETRHAILFGSFPSRSEAERAATELPPGTGTSAPWIRRFSEVQPAARAAAE